MKVKYSIGLLLALILTAGVALAQQTPPPAPPEPPDDVIDQNFSFFIDGGGFLGIYAENISRENMGRYRMSQVRGVGVTQVIKDSPAEKAGLRKDDVILRLDGENVSSVRKLNRLVSELSPDQSVKVSISRGGSEQEITATIGKRSNTMANNLHGGEPRIFKWEGPGLKNFKWEPPLLNDLPNFNNDGGNMQFFLNNSRRIGVSTMSLTKQLADFFGIADGKGALVTSVTEDGPAAKAGVKAGDVITAVDGEAVDSPGDISRVINRKKEGDVTLTIIRNKSQQTIHVTPRDGGGGFPGTMGNPQIGRRIVIPRIEIQPIPDIDIAMPNVVIGPSPTINVQMPRIRVTPRVVRVRGPQGPI